MSDKTIKKDIKKAKDSGIIANMGSKKYPKWTMDIAQSTPLKPEREVTQDNISRVIKSLKSIDEYLYYTGEGKDKFDEWFDFSLANS